MYNRHYQNTKSGDLGTLITRRDENRLTKHESLNLHVFETENRGPNGDESRPGIPGEKEMGCDPKVKEICSEHAQTIEADRRNGSGLEAVVASRHGSNCTFVRARHAYRKAADTDVSLDSCS